MYVALLFKICSGKSTHTPGDEDPASTRDACLVYRCANRAILHLFNVYVRESVYLKDLTQCCLLYPFFCSINVTVHSSSTKRFDSNDQHASSLPGAKTFGTAPDKSLTPSRTHGSFSTRQDSGRLTPALTSGFSRRPANDSRRPKKNPISLCFLVSGGARRPPFAGHLGSRKPRETWSLGWLRV